MRGGPCDDGMPPVAPTARTSRRAEFRPSERTPRSRKRYARRRARNQCTDCGAWSAARRGASTAPTAPGPARRRASGAAGGRHDTRWSTPSPATSTGTFVSARRGRDGCLAFSRLCADDVEFVVDAPSHGDLDMAGPESLDETPGGGRTPRAGLAPHRPWASENRAGAGDGSRLPRIRSGPRLRGVFRLKRRQDPTATVDRSTAPARRASGRARVGSAGSRRAGIASRPARSAATRCRQPTPSLPSLPSRRPPPVTPATRRTALAGFLAHRCAAR